MKGSVDIVQV